MSVDRSRHRFVAHQLDHPGDLAPAAEMDDIAEVAAAVGAKRGLVAGKGAETFDQLRRLGEGGGFEGGLVKQAFPLGTWCPAALAGAGFETAQAHD